MTGPLHGMSAFACVLAAWHAHEAELRGYLLHRSARADAADDVLQDVFLKAMRHGQGFCSLDNPRAWLFQVARNTLVDRARTAHAHETLTDDLAEHTPAPESTLVPVDALSDCLVRNLADLSPDDADIVRACDLGGQSQREYAAAHGLSLPAVKSRLLRARQRLRDRISLVCRVQFEPDGRVQGHAGRADAG